jgi:hypothetical protein
MANPDFLPGYLAARPKRLPRGPGLHPDRLNLTDHAPAGRSPDHGDAPKVSPSVTRRAHSALMEYPRVVTTCGRPRSTGRHAPALTAGDVSSGTVQRRLLGEAHRTRRRVSENNGDNAGRPRPSSLRADVSGSVLIGQAGQVLQCRDVEERRNGQGD